MNSWIYLFVAIFSEVIATSALRVSEGFSKRIPSIVVIVGYSSAFYFLGLTLKTIPVGVAYAIWSGVGTVAIAMIGWLVFKQHLNLAQVAGLILVIAGVLLLQLNTPAAH